MNNFKSVHQKHILYIINSTAFIIPRPSLHLRYKTPMSQCPVELFPSVGMKMSIEIPMGVENLVQVKNASGNGSGVQFLPFNFQLG